MATVPGQQVVPLIHPAFRYTPSDALMAAGIMASKGKFALPDQPPTQTMNPYGRWWQGFQSRFPKESFDPEKARGRPDPNLGVFDESIKSLVTGKEQYGYGRD